MPASVFEPVAAEGRMLLERGIPRADPWHARALADYAAQAGDIPSARKMGPAVVDRARRAPEKHLAQTPAAAMLVQRVDDDFHGATGTALSAWVFASALRTIPSRGSAGSPRLRTTPRRPMPASA